MIRVAVELGNMKVGVWVEKKTEIPAWLWLGKDYMLHHKELLYRINGVVANTRYPRETDKAIGYEWY